MGREAEPAASVRVRVVPGAVLMDGGYAHDEGDELDVTEQDARALEDAGTVERVEPASRRRTKRRP